MKRIAILIIALSISLAAQQAPANTKAAAAKPQTKSVDAYPDLEELNKRSARFAPTEIRVNTLTISGKDRTVLTKLIQAARVLNDIFLEQRWEGNHEMLAKLEKDKSPLGKARLNYFRINQGPWDELNEHKAFVPGAPATKPEGANFYPADAKREELEAWFKSLSEQDRALATGFFSIIRRDESGKFKAIPYSEAYKDRLTQAAGLLREAAQATDNASLKKFLTTRADAFLSNNYYESDVAWMDLDSLVDVTIGPYETYNDELFGYKAAFEAYVNLRDQKETQKLAFFSGHLQEIENNLPMDEKYRNPKIGALSPIVVVNQISATGDGNMGVTTAAYNLPNDETVVEEKGSKRILLKNVQEAKFNKTLIPISKVVLSPAAQADVNFDSFFTHVLAHELTHGLGPQQIEKDGKTTSVRQELKEAYSAMEEAKADVTSLFALQYLMDQNKLKDGLGQGTIAERRLYNTYLASSFRTLRFGTKSSHARGMAMQFNYLVEKGAFKVNPNGTFEVDFSKIKNAIRDLDRELLTIQATGDYNAAKAMLAKYSVISPAMQRAMDKLQNVPTDIQLIEVTANQFAPPGVKPGEELIELSRRRGVKWTKDPKKAPAKGKKQ